MKSFNAETMRRAAERFNAKFEMEGRADTIERFTVEYDEGKGSLYPLCHKRNGQGRNKYRVRLRETGKTVASDFSDDRNPPKVVHYDALFYAEKKTLEYAAKDNWLSMVYNAEVRWRDDPESVMSVLLATADSIDDLPEGYKDEDIFWYGFDSCEDEDYSQWGLCEDFEIISAVFADAA